MIEFSTREIAERLGVHQNTVASWIDKGWLKARKMGPGRNSPHRVASEDLVEFLEEHPEMGIAGDVVQK